MKTHWPLGNFLWARCVLFPAFGVLLLGGAGCERPMPPLRVGANVWPGYEPMFLAQSLGYYQGANIRLVNFGSTAEVSMALRNNLIDVAAVTLDEALSLSSLQPNRYRVVLVCDVSKGGDVILAKRESRSVADLKGRRVAVETTAVGIYVLSRALELNGLTAGDVKIEAISHMDQSGALAGGLVDAAVTYEPHRTRLLAAGLRQIFDSTQLPGEIIDVLLAPRELSGRQQQLRALADGWFQGLEYLRTNPADAARRAASREGVTPQEFLASLAGLEFVDRAANLRMLNGSAHDLRATFRRLSSVMVRHKLLHMEPSLPYWDDTFVRNQRP